jgi:hypothetical protein
VSERTEDISGTNLLKQWWTPNHVDGGRLRDAAKIARIIDTFVAIARGLNGGGIENRLRPSGGNG